MKHVLGKVAKIAPATGNPVVAANATASHAAEKAIAVAQSAQGLAADAADSIVKLSHVGRDKAQELADVLRAYLEAWVKQKLYGKLELLVDKLPPLAKDMLEDPEMPRCVSRGKDRVVDAVWPDIRSEIMWEIAILIDGRAQDSEEQDKRPGRCCLLAFVRYHLLPYDKTIWGKLKDPWWVIMSLITLVPVLGVSPICFFILFFIIDKGDEFQLVQFILQFKGTQFLSVGLIRMVMGYVFYIACVTAPADPRDHRCQDEGPGSSGSIILTSIGMLFQLVLTWVAFVLLRFSESKGRSELRGVLGQDEKGRHLHRKGGYIKWFLFYDLFVFIVITGILVYVLTTVSDPFDWPVKHTVFALQILYGLLAFPFFWFTLPGLQLVLTHAVPTAYDRKGRCRKPISPPAREKTKKEMEEAQNDQQKRPALVTDVDIAQIIDKIKATLPDQVSGMISVGRKTDSMSDAKGV